MHHTHPQMAKRWETATPKGKVNQKDTRQTFKPGVAKLPKRTDATDFLNLSPGPKSRHRLSVPAKEQDSMKEGPISFVPGSRGRHLDKFKRKGR